VSHGPRRPRDAHYHRYHHVLYAFIMKRGSAGSPCTWICPASARAHLLSGWPYNCVWKSIHAGSTFIRSSTSRSSTLRAPRAYLSIVRRLGRPIAVTTTAFSGALALFRPCMHTGTSISGLADRKALCLRKSRSHHRKVRQRRIHRGSVPP